MAKSVRKGRHSTKPQYSELGDSGLIHSSGIIREEFLNDLRGSKGAKVYREMSENDPVIGAFLFAVEQIMRQVEWKVVPFDESAAAQQDAEFVDSCRLDMAHTWGDFITEVLSFLPYGFAPIEVVYKLRKGPTGDPKTHSRYTDGQIGWRKLALRSQDSVVRWGLNPSGDIESMTQRRQDGKEVLIPIDRMLLFRTKAYKNNPEGRSILRNAYRPWYFKKRIEEVEGIGVERDLAGLPVLTTPEGLDLWNTQDARAVQTRNAAEEIVRGLRRDEMEGVLLPFGWQLELLASKGTRLFDTSTIVNRYDQRIAMTVLADFMMLGASKTGSFALAKSKTSVFMISMIGYVNVIRDVFNQYAIPRLFELNGWPIEQLPKLDYDAVEVPVLRDLAVFLRVLFDAGITLDDNLIRHLLNLAGLPADLSDEAGQGGTRRSRRSKKGGERGGQPQPDEGVTDPLSRV